MASLRISLSRSVILIMLVVGLAICKPASADDASATFKTKCAACHGADGKAETAMGKKMAIKDLASADVQKRSDGELTAIIADGKEKMPSYKKSLKPEQIKDLVGFIRSLGKK